MNGAPLFSLQIYERKAHTSALVGMPAIDLPRRCGPANHSTRSPRSPGAALVQWAETRR
jgi:hypothetical protein